MIDVFRFTCALDPLYGGVPQGISSISKGTNEYGISTTIISCGNSRKVRLRNCKLVEDLIDHNVRVISSKALFTNPYGLGGIFRVTLQLLRINKPKMVVIHQIWSMSTFLAYAYSRIFSINYVVMPHGSLSKYHMIKKRKLKRTVYSLFIKKVLEKASKIVVTSRLELDDLEEYFIPKVSIIPYAVSPQAVSCDSRVDNQILFASRLAEKKNLDKIIRAIPLIRKQIDDVTLIVAGDGPKSEVDRIKNLVAELGLEKEIKLLGWLGRTDLGLVMSQSQVFVLPSEYENFAHSVMECLASGTPAVISNRVALAEIVGKYNAGVVINKSTPTAIADAVVSSLNNFENLSVNAMEAAVKEFGWDTVGLAWRKLIEH